MLMILRYLTIKFYLALMFIDSASCKAMPKLVNSFLFLSEGSECGIEKVRTIYNSDLFFFILTVRSFIIGLAPKDYQVDRFIGTT